MRFGTAEKSPMPAHRRGARKATVKLKTITGLELAQWRVLTMDMTQEELAKWLGRTRGFVSTAERLDDADIPRAIYLECMGLAAELGKQA